MKKRSYWFMLKYGKKKTPQYCKAIIFQLKINFSKKENINWVTKYKNQKHKNGHLKWEKDLNLFTSLKKINRHGYGYGFFGYASTCTYVEFHMLIQ